MTLRTSVCPAALPALLLLLPVAPCAVQAQTGVLAGQVVSAETGVPLQNASVEVIGAGGTPAGSVLTGANGQFRLTLDPGAYAVIVSIIGYESQRLEPVRISAEATEQLTIALRSRALLLNPVVVSASRREERALDAPASVALVNEEEVRSRPAVATTDHLRSVPGVDIASHGIQSANIVTRGFNNIFSGALHMLTDHRIAGVPSLRVNLLHFAPTTDEDIERVEVVLGPGSALYGPNTANGVLHVFTHSPLDRQGTTFSVSGGERSVFQGTFRTSHLLSDGFGLKVSGEYLRGEEWEHEDPVEQRARDEALETDPNTRIGDRDFSLERLATEVRADWQVDDQTTAVFSWGRTQAASGIELTGVGGGQVDDWVYSYYQARLNRGRFFAQAYLNTSDSGDTFTLRDGFPIVDESSLFVTQLQHGLELADGRQSFTYGADFLRTMPETRGTIHGRNEDDDTFNEFGLYLQSETSLTSTLELVVAARGDWHSELESGVFSPRAALVYSPRDGQAFRATYNRAFSTPTSTNLFLDINAGPFPDPQLAQLGYGLRAQGTGSTGFSFRREDGSLTGMRSPFNPQGGHQLLPADPALMWQFAVGVLQAQGTVDSEVAQFLLGQTPTGGEVGMAYLDVLAFEVPRPLTDDQAFHFDPIRESTTTTYEVGYSGIVADRLLLSADVWHSERRNFISALRPVTPLLFLEGQSLAAHVGQALVTHLVVEQGYSPQEAQQRALGIIVGTEDEPGMARLPLGVLSSEEVSSVDGRSDFLVTYRNFGRVTLSGVDFAARFLLNDVWTLGGSFSWVSKDHFETEGEQIALNAPTTKLMSFVSYRDRRSGVSGELRLRYNNEFPVLSSPYVATACLGDTGPLVEPCVESFTLVDVTAGYQLRWIPGASVSVSVQNAFDTGYRSFAGVPEIGRMALVRLRYEF